MTYHIARNPHAVAYTNFRIQADSLESAIMAAQDLWICQPGDTITISDTRGRLLARFHTDDNRQLVASL